jgi:hypothetical protein
MEIEVKTFPYKRSERRCYSCKEVKPIEEFSKDKSRPGGYGYRCKKCNNINRHKKHDTQKKI